MDVALFWPWETAGVKQIRLRNLALLAFSKPEAKPTLTKGVKKVSGRTHQPQKKNAIMTP
jgi:hypothetical protein